MVQFAFKWETKIIELFNLDRDYGFNDSINVVNTTTVFLSLIEYTTKEGTLPCSLLQYPYPLVI